MNVDDVVLAVLSGLVVLAGIAASGYSWRLLREARLDVRVAEVLAPERKELRVIGEGHVRSERNRLWTQLSFVGVGLVSLSSNYVDAIPPLLRLASRLLIVAGILLVYLNSVLNARTRRTAVALIRAEKEVPAQEG